MSTPEEMAASNNGPEKNRWLLEASRHPRDILRFIQASPTDAHSSHLARSVLGVRLSEEQTRSAESLERYTRQLVSLTWALVWLTVVLLAATVGLAIFHK